MAGIKDLLNLFYWINNQKESFMDASIGQERAGIHQSDYGAGGHAEGNMTTYPPREGGKKPKKVNFCKK